MSGELERLPGWDRQLDQQIAAGRWSTVGLFAHLDDPERSNRFGEWWAVNKTEHSTLIDDLIAGRFVRREELIVAPTINIFDWFTPITGEEAVCLLIERCKYKYKPDRARQIGASWRQKNTEQGIPATYPVCYRVRADFTLKWHAPKAGPCRKDFRYLQKWNFPDEATKDSLVFWVPGVLSDSTSKDVSQQRQLLSDTRVRLELPAHHMSDFNKVALVAGLFLAHSKVTGERISLVVRTDTCVTGGGRLCLSWGEGDLYCDYWDYGAEPYDGVGVLALGVEELGS